MTTPSGWRQVAAGALLLVAACTRAVPRTAASPPAEPTPAASPSPAPAASPAPSPSPTPAATTAGSPTRAPTSSPAAAPAAPAPATCSVAPQPPFPASIPASFATALAAAPDGRLFYAERSGTIRVWQDGGARVFARVPTVTTEAGGGYSERGLLGLAVSPRFAEDRFVYAFYSNQDRAHQDIVRFTDCAGEARDRRLLVQVPAGSDCCHKGGRIAFGPDGTLFVTLGDQHVPSVAQDTDDVRGKVLRYNADGSVPGDNPFGSGNPVWAYGFRNPFGLSVSASGQVAVTSNGPTGDAGSPRTGYDTVIASVARGAGYQWPVCYGYSHPIAPAVSCPPGQPGPDWSSETTAAVPTGAAWVDASGPAAYAGRLVFCTLNGGMRILTPGAPATVVPGPAGCRLDVIQGPDRAVYYADSTRIWREPGLG